MTIELPRPILPTPTSIETDIPLSKNAFELSHLEKQELHKKKRRRLIHTSEIIHAAPIRSITPPCPSPPRSPSPILPIRDTSPIPEQLPPPPQPPSPIHLESDPSPQPSPNQPEAEAGPSQTRVPTPSHAETDSSPNASGPTSFRLSFFPTEPISTIPTQLFSAFNLPADNAHYPTDPDGLLTTTGIYLGQALGGFSRLLTLQNTNKDQADTIRRLQMELAQLKTDHQTLHDDHQTLQTQHTDLQTQHATLQTQHTDLGSQHATLQTQTAKLTHQNQTLRDKLSNLAEERTTLLRDRTERTNKLEEAQTQISKLQADAEEKNEALRVVAANTKLLEEENHTLKVKAQSLVEESRHGIIEDYKRSEELKNAVADQYNLGYAYAKKKVVQAGVNPITLGFSSDEDASDAEPEEASRAQDLTDPPLPVNNPDPPTET